MALLLSLFVSLLFLSSSHAHEECEHVLLHDPSSFINNSQHPDCNYLFPQQTPASEQEHSIDLFWIITVHKYASSFMPFVPFGAAIVDSRSNSLISIGTNMFNSNNDYFSQIMISHAETTVITNATITTLKDEWNETTGIRTPHPDWKYMTLYGNVEACPSCAQGAIWRGLRRMVFGARASSLAKKRCWNQSSLSVYEVVDHSSNWAPFEVIRGPMMELEDSILSSFSNSC